MNESPLNRSGRSDTRRRLYRSDDDRIVSGVAGGIAEYFDIDPVIVRIAFVVLTLAGGAGFIGYIAAWVLLPEHDGSAAWMSNTKSQEGRRLPGRADARQLGAIALVGIGAVMLLDRIGIGIDGGIAWPVALIGGGAAVLWGQRNRAEDGPGPDAPTATGTAGRRDDAGGSDGEGPGGGSGGPDGSGGSGGPGGATGGPSGGVGLATMTTPSTDLVVRPDNDPANVLAAPVDESASTEWRGTWSEESRADAGIGVTDPPQSIDRGRARRSSARARRRAGRAGRTPFARAALGLFVALSGAVLLAGRLGAFDTSSDRGVDGALAVLLIARGSVLSLGAWLGRPRGFIFLGLVTGAVLIASSAIDVSWSGGFGDRLLTPTTASVQPTYRLTAGQLHLDLSDVDMRHQRVRVAGEVSVGRLLIEVPRDVKVVVVAKAAAGHTVLFGAEEGGATVERQASQPGRSESDGTLYIDAKVGLGELEVARVGQSTTGDWKNR